MIPAPSAVLPPPTDMQCWLLRFQNSTISPSWSAGDAIPIPPLCRVAVGADAGITPAANAIAPSPTIPRRATPQRPAEPRFNQQGIQRLRSRRAVS
ncbi:hypothetical protein [Streptomyces sp. NPDC050485]|uniref:hypothetical protein n=1 Tax=Streptomyces sp. NPDC050485 TaxID=3365617 RepID=UPI00379489A6